MVSEKCTTTNAWSTTRVRLHQTLHSHRIFFHLFRYLVEKWLSPTLGDQKLFVELSKEKPPTPDLVRSLYTISIRTADVVQNQVPENVEMSIQGSDKQIGKILLKDHAKENQQPFFQRGNLDQFEIEHENIGKVRSYHYHILILLLLDREHYHWFQ